MNYMENSYGEAPLMYITLVGTVLQYALVCQ